MRRNFIICFSLIFFFLLNWGCKKDSLSYIEFNDVKENDVVFNNILILGNSITKHPPLPNVGWYGNWGMAASSEDKDFVHVLEKKYKEINPAATVTPVIIVDWEGSHHIYDLTNLDQYFTKMPDMVILRLGENVREPTNLSSSLEKLIDYIKLKSPNTKFIITGVIWTNKPVEDQLQSVAFLKSIPFIKMDYLNTAENASRIGAIVKDVDGNFYKINNSAVANHPGDVGMRKIAALLYNALIDYKF